MTHHTYISPLATRYASKEMSALFSDQFKYATWRKLWTALAKAQKHLGLPITELQIKAMEHKIDAIDFEKAALYETQLHHDVMAHIHTFGDACPEARAIIHLGATSCFVTDNTELMQMREALKLLKKKITQTIKQLSEFAKKHADLPTLSFTHYQSAQPTTVGKRACLWIQDLLIDLSEIDHRLSTLRFLGAKGATGTQASFLSLFDGDSKKVDALEQLIAQEMHWDHLFLISGQTYPRKQDTLIFSALSCLAASCHKFATDIRLLSNMKEIEEPFGTHQVGSSAMPYKRNPMRCERICGLSRFLLSLSENPAYTAALQWLERTLDDSSNRRLAIPEVFLCADAILNLMIEVTSGLVVYPNMIARHLEEELPFMASEEILMSAVKKGKDRQHLHARLREHSLAASKKMKEDGAHSDLIERIAHDREFNLSRQELEAILDAKKLTGRAKEQTERFLSM
jgi:adenylosuccinate lyase